MSEVTSPPVKITVGEHEYDCFGEEHSWNDIARWIKSRGPADVKEFRYAMSQVSGDDQ